jgi:hypothetical protein
VRQGQSWGRVLELGDVKLCHFSGKTYQPLHETSTFYCSYCACFMRFPRVNCEKRKICRSPPPPILSMFFQSASFTNTFQVLLRSQEGDCGGKCSLLDRGSVVVWAVSIKQLFPRHTAKIFFRNGLIHHVTVGACLREAFKLLFLDREVYILTVVKI